VVKQVQKKLGVKVGDLMIFVEDEKGNVILKKGQLNEI
jgi:bifunctional DNA-binding transcriptional regulator/antitoxin component of YhaV-PrlF toxin-antitoxin module